MVLTQLMAYSFVCERLELRISPAGTVEPQLCGQTLRFSHRNMSEAVRRTRGNSRCRAHRGLWRHRIKLLGMEIHFRALLFPQTICQAGARRA